MSNTQKVSQQGSGKRFLVPAVSFALGVALAALVFFAMPRQNTSVSTPEEEATTTTEAASSEATTAQASFDNANIDYAKTFPSWSKDSKSLAELVSFVADVTNKDSKNYKEPAERIATFDMDGTIICEKAPIYVDYMLLIHRVLDDPAYTAEPDVVELLQKIRDAAMRGEKKDEYSPGKHVAIAHEFVGMTPEEFRTYVNDFIDSVPAVGFDGMTYGQSFYKPMLEVIDYLRANDFDVWMVSACEREVTRAVVERLGIPADHVVATNVAYATTGLGNERSDEYTMEQGEQVIMSEPLDDIECGKTGKVLAIAREIGSHPLLAFGNSSGDYAMLNYAEASGGMGLLVVADDTEREYGSAQKSAEQYDLIKQESWTGFSMADDWATIYGDGVTKTELPGLVEEELDQAA